MSARYKAFIHTANSATQFTASRAYACGSGPDTSTSASWQRRGIRVSCLRECAAPPARPPPSRACQARTSTRTTPATPASTTAPTRPRRHRSSLAHRPPLQAPAPLGCSLNAPTACAHVVVGPGAHLQGPRERYEAQREATSISPPLQRSALPNLAGAMAPHPHPYVCATFAHLTRLGRRRRARSGIAGDDWLYRSHAYRRAGPWCVDRGETLFSIH